MERMEPAVWVRGYRMLFAVLALVTIAYQCWYLVGNAPNFQPENFFSFFTIESNLFAAAALIWCALGPSERVPASTVALIRGAAVLYMSITGLVYGLLLSGYQQELNTAIPWVDTVVHKIMPLLMVVDWLIEPPVVPIRLRRAMIWLVYPLVYATYSLIRGPFAGWYPYPFLDPARAGGYGAVVIYCVCIAAGALLFTWLVVTIGNRLRLGTRAKLA